MAFLNVKVLETLQILHTMNFWAIDEAYCPSNLKWNPGLNVKEQNHLIIWQVYDTLEQMTTSRSEKKECIRTEYVWDCSEQNNFFPAHHLQQPSQPGKKWTLFVNCIILKNILGKHYNHTWHQQALVWKQTIAMYPEKKQILQLTTVINKIRLKVKATFNPSSWKP